MAKGDHGRMQDEIAQQKNLTQYGYGYKPPTWKGGAFGRFGGNAPISPGTPGVGGMEGLLKGLSTTNDMFMKQYRGVMGYDDVMDSYNFMKDNSARAGAERAYSDLAGGGVNETAFRARAISPVRAAYANAERNLNRSKSLTGGGAGYAANAAKMARNESSMLADKSMEAEGALQELISRNKAAGAGGLGNLAGLDLSYLRDTSNNLLESQGQQISGQSLMNELARTFMEARYNNSKIPGNFSQALGNIGGILGLISKGAGLFNGLGGLFGGGGGSTTFADYGSNDYGFADGKVAKG